MNCVREFTIQDLTPLRCLATRYAKRVTDRDGFV